MASRLVTLSGPGGIGKTRLAVELAVAPAPLVGPAWFVALAPVLASDGVATSVARALQLAELPGHEIDLLCDYLSRRPGLLVLDTCEHVVKAVAGLATRLLSHCPDLRILATTRQPLRAPGEQIVPLSGLGRPRAPKCSPARARAARILRPSSPPTECEPSSASSRGSAGARAGCGQDRLTVAGAARQEPGSSRSTRSQVTRSRVIRGIAPCGLSSAGAATYLTSEIRRRSPHCRCS